LAEVEIRLGYHEEAHHRLDKLLQIYRGWTTPDIVDRLGHIRALMAAVRVSGLQNAVRLWTDALHWNRIYNPLEKEVFTCGVIYMFLCLGQYKLGKVRISATNQCRAWERGRAWVDFVSTSITVTSFGSIQPGI